MAIAAGLPQACGMLCHDCQTEFPLAPGESLGFRAECDRCRADLRVCLNCVHHDPSVYNECRESNAERILDRERANRCDYFRPGSARGGETESVEEAKQNLEDLFK